MQSTGESILIALFIGCDTFITQMFIHWDFCSLNSKIYMIFQISPVVTCFYGNMPICLSILSIAEATSSIGKTPRYIKGEFGCSI